MDYHKLFGDFVARPIVREATKPLSDSTQILLKISGSPTELTFEKKQGVPTVAIGAPSTPDIVLEFTPLAVEEIMKDTAQDIGALGISAAKLVLSNHPDKKLSIRVHAGVLSLISNGYLGVIKLGGSTFASYLASKGLKSLGSLKDLVKKLKG